jgi:hypothetical protein
VRLVERDHLRNREVVARQRSVTRRLRRLTRVGALVGQAVSPRSVTPSQFGWTGVTTGVVTVRSHQWRRAVIGFDHVQLFSNGTPPGKRTVAEDAVAALFAVYPPMLEAEYALDRDGDAEGLATALTNAIALMPAAVDAVTALPEEVGKKKKKKTPRQKALKDLDKAVERLEKAQKLLTKKGIKKANGMRKHVHKAALFVLRAGDRILPGDLRNSLPVPGQTLK